MIDNNNTMRITFKHPCPRCYHMPHWGWC